MQKVGCIGTKKSKTRFSLILLLVVVNVIKHLCKWIKCNHLFSFSNTVLHVESIFKFKDTVVYLCIFNYLAPPAKSLSSDVIMHAVHF